jgi:hypothetical protein
MAGRARLPGQFHDAGVAGAVERAFGENGVKLLCEQRG